MAIAVAGAVGIASAVRGGWGGTIAARSRCGCRGVALIQLQQDFKRRRRRLASPPRIACALTRPVDWQFDEAEWVEISGWKLMADFSRTPPVRLLKALWPSA
jgi:hypothetical protein